VPAFWGALSIVAIWLAVLFDGICARRDLD
jgi:hypothetical protein